MDQGVRQTILAQVRWLVDEVAPHDLHAARAAFEEMVARYGIEAVLSAMRGDRPKGSP